MAVRVKHDLCRVIEEHTGGLVAHKVAEAVFGAVVDPLLDPDLGLLSGLHFGTGAGRLRLAESVSGSLGLLVELTARADHIVGAHLLRLSHLAASSRRRSRRHKLTNVGRGWRACERRRRQQLRDPSTIVEPRMAQNFINGRAASRIIRQNTLDEVPGAITNLHRLRERVIVHPNALVGCLDVIGLEWRLANDKSVDDDAQRPDVDLVRVTLLALQHLGSNIVRSTANGSLALAVELELRSKTEVTYLDLHLVVEEQVTQLKVTMDDSVTVQVLDGIANLDNVALHLELVQSLSSSQKLVERRRRAHFEQDVHVLGVFEEVLEADDILVMQTAMNLDLTHELLLGARLGQCRLVNDLGRSDAVVLLVGELVAAGETTLAEETAFTVSLDTDVAVEANDLFFNDRICLLLVLLLHLMSQFMSLYTLFLHVKC